MIQSGRVVDKTLIVREYLFRKPLLFLFIKLIVPAKYFITSRPEDF